MIPAIAIQEQLTIASRSDHITVRNAIISKLYSSKQFNDCINKMEPASLRDDLRSEVITILLSQPRGRVEKIERDGKLVAFAVRVILNTVKSKTSPFAKMFKTGYCELSEADEPIHETVNGRVQLEAAQEPMYDILVRVGKLAYSDDPQYLVELMPEIGWYKQYMLSLYMKLGNYRKMEAHTGIAWESCYKTVRETICLLRKRYCNVKD